MPGMHESGSAGAASGREGASRRTGPVTILIVDDHDLFREGVAAILRHDRRIAVVGEGSSSNDAVALTASLDPDVLLLDVELPGGPAKDRPKIRRNVEAAIQQLNDLGIVVQEWPTR